MARGKRETQERQSRVSPAELTYHTKKRFSCTVLTSIHQKCLPVARRFVAWGGRCSATASSDCAQSHSCFLSLFSPAIPSAPNSDHLYRSNERYIYNGKEGVMKCISGKVYRNTVGKVHTNDHENTLIRQVMYLRDCFCVVVARPALVRRHPKATQQQQP